jgi:hypothetical protein
MKYSHPLAEETSGHLVSDIRPITRPLFVSAVLLVACCLVCPLYWVHWSAAPAYCPDWGQRPISWLDRLVAPLAFLGSVAGTTAAAVRRQGYGRWVLAAAAMLVAMLVQPLLDLWLAGDTQ